METNGTDVKAMTAGQYEDALDDVLAWMAGQNAGLSENERGALECTYCRQYAYEGDPVEHNSDCPITKARAVVEQRKSAHQTLLGLYLTQLRALREKIWSMKNTGRDLDLFGCGENEGYEHSAEMVGDLIAGVEALQQHLTEPG